MEFKDYQNKLVELENQFKKDKSNLAKEYALSNNQYPIDSIVTDHIGKIKIEKIQIEYESFTRNPICVYFGIELKADGTPKKNNSKRYVYESNIK